MELEFKHFWTFFVILESRKLFTKRLIRTLEILMIRAKYFFGQKWALEIYLFRIGSILEISNEHLKLSEVIRLRNTYSVEQMELKRFKRFEEIHSLTY